MPDKPITILMVEDDDVDIRVVQRAFKQQKLSNPIVVAHDGVEGLAMLRGEDGYEKLEGPLLVLLDLNMPRMGGHEFLTELRNDPQLASTIVFVLTTSNDERDRVAAYDRNVAGYLLKPEAGRELMDHLPLLENYMLSVQFPTNAPSNGSIDAQRQATGSV